MPSRDPATIIPANAVASSAVDAAHWVAGFAVERQRHGPLLGAPELLSSIDSWLASGVDRGWLLVTGAPGAGKSALLARLVAHLGSGADLPPHHFIRRGHSDWDQPFAIQSSLVAQIEARYQAVANPDGKPERRLLELLLRVANRYLIPGGQRLILILDGLDEVTAPTDELPLGRVLPSALPPGVFLIASLRSGQLSQDFFSRRQATLIDLDRALGSRGVRAFWAHHGPRLGLPLAYQQTAARAAEGSLLHAALLCISLEQQPFGGRQQRIEVPVPFGLWALLSALSRPIWDGDGSADGLAQAAICRVALGLLAAAREALPLALLAELCGVGELPPLFALAQATFLIEDSPPGAAFAHYRLGHDAGRELVLARLGSPELRRLHRLLAQQLASWPSAAASGDFRQRYALRHALLHRVEAGDFSGVEQLTADSRYLIEKVRQVGTLALENDFALAAAHCPDPVRRKEWRDLQRAVREEAHWLRRDPDSLPSLLYNRLRLLGWPGGRIGRALAMQPAASDQRLQRSLGGPEKTLHGHASSVYGCCCSSDGQLLISASWDRTLKVWDPATGHQLLTLKGHSAEVTACVLLPGEQQLLSSSADNTLKLWQLQSGAVVTTLLGHTGEVTACAAFPDGQRVLSAARDKTLRIWDLKTGQTRQTLKGHLSWVTACGVVGAGERVLSGSWDRTLKLWDAATGRELATLSGHAAGVRTIAVLPGGRRAISGSEDHTLRLWDLSAGRQLAAFHGHTAGVTSCAVLPDGLRMVSAAKDQTLRVWDLHSGELLATLQGHSAWVTACAALPDGRQVVSGSDDYSLKIWDLTAAHRLHELSGHTAAVSACALVGPSGLPGSDGEAPARLLTGAADRSLKLWDLRSGTALLTLHGHGDLITSCAVLPDGQRAISGSWDRTVRIWDLTTGGLLRTLTGHQWFVTACAVLPSGQQAVSGSWDRSLRLWDLDTGSELLRLSGHSAQITCVAALPGSQQVLSGSRDGTLRLWELSSGRELAVLRGHLDFVTACAVLPDGQSVLSASEDHTLKLWDLRSGESRRTLHGHAAAVSACAITHGGRWAVSASVDHTIRVWDLQSGRCLDTIYGTAAFESIAVFGNRICAGDRLGTVWMLKIGQPDG